jgi:hypothetical protein
MSVGRTSVRGMSSSGGSDREAITAAFDRLDAADDQIAALSFDALTTPELLALLERLETNRRCCTG